MKIFMIENEPCVHCSNKKKLIEVHLGHLGCYNSCAHIHTTCIKHTEMINLKENFPIQRHLKGNDRFVSIYCNNLIKNRLLYLFVS